MAEFKVGDRVKITGDCHANPQNIGRVLMLRCKVTSPCSSCPGHAAWHLQFRSGEWGDCIPQSCLELVEE